MKWTRARKQSLTFARKITHSTAGESKGIQWDNIPILAGSLNLPVSISIWIKQTLANQSHQHLIFVDQTSADGDDGGVRLYESGAGTLVFDIKTSSVFAKYDVATEKTPLNEWVHVAATWQGTVGGTAPKVYVNGNLQTSGTPTVGSGTRSAAGGSHCIGGRNSAINRGWGGLVAGAGKWVRELSAAEVKKLSEGVHPLEFPEGLVICPDFQTLENLASGTTEKLPNFIEHDGTMYAGPPQLQYRKPRFALADVPIDTRHVPIERQVRSNQSTFFVEASNAAIEIAKPIVTGPPFTISAWVRPAAAAATQTIATISDTGVPSAQHTLIQAGNAFEARSRNTSFETATATGTVSNGVWQHACGVWASNALRAAYYNGGGKGTDTTSVTNPTLDGFAVGVLNDSSPGANYDGNIAHVAVWAAALTDTEVQQLAQGVSPLNIRRGALMGYWPMHFDGSRVEDVVGGNHLDIITGTLQFSNLYPPKILLPSKTIVAPIPEALPDIAKVDITRTDMPLKPLL